MGANISAQLRFYLHVTLFETLAEPETQYCYCSETSNMLEKCHEFEFQRSSLHVSLHFASLKSKVEGKIEMFISRIQTPGIVSILYYSIKIALHLSLECNPYMYFT
jgi:hypothetical protein